MSTHNLKKRKRAAGDAEIVQVIPKQYPEHLVSDDSSAATSNRISSHQVNSLNLPAVNKRVRYNSSDLNLSLATPIRDVASKTVTEVSSSSKREEALKMALSKVQELQDELHSLSDDDESDEGDWAFKTPEFVGFAVCLRETLSFLAAQGLSEDDPMVTNLKNSLVEAMPL